MYTGIYVHVRIHPVSSKKASYMFSGGNYSLAFWISTILLGVASIIHTVAYIAKRRLHAASR